MAIVTKHISKDEQIVRAGQVKAAIMEYLDAESSFESPRKRTYSEIVQALSDKLKELTYNPANLRGLLHQLVDNKLINSETVGTRNVVYFSLKVAKEQIETKAAIQVSKPVVNTAPPAVAKNGVPALTIDIVKATGRLRLNFQGIIIELGTADK